MEGRTFKLMIGGGGGCREETVNGSNQPSEQTQEGRGEVSATGTSESNHEACRGSARRLGRSHGRDLGPERSSQSTNVPHKLGRVNRLGPLVPSEAAARDRWLRDPAAAPWASAAFRGVCFSAHVPVPGGQNRPPAESTGNREWTPVITGQSCALSTGTPAASLCPPCPVSAQREEGWTQPQPPILPRGLQPGPGLGRAGGRAAWEGDVRRFSCLRRDL